MSAARPQPESSTVSRVLAGTTLALKVAREATDSVSIAKQILGSAAHISEFAEKIEKNRKAMNDLIAKSAEYACHIDTIVAGRIVESKVLSNLRRLRSVFTKIEALVAEAAAVRVKNFMKRWFHNTFTAPNRASDLASELEKEMQLFQLAMMLDVRLAISETAQETLLAIHENDLYDADGFRRLRPADVRKLEELPTARWLEDSNVAFSKARVDGELMVLRCPRSSGPLPSAWATNLDILKQLSYPRTQHPNVVQLYGQGVGNPENAFVAFRSGCHKFRDYVEQHKADMSPQQKAFKAFEVAIKLLNAVKHLERVENIVWDCGYEIGMFAVDDECNPTIGLFDEFKHKYEVVRSTDSADSEVNWAVYYWFTTHASAFGAVQDLQVVRAIVCESDVPREILQLLQRLQDENLHANCMSQSIPIDYPSTSFAPATVALAREDLQSLKPSDHDTELCQLWLLQPSAHILGSHQCESIWNFEYRTGYTREGEFDDYIYLERCWIENGSRRYEEVGFYLGYESAVECRAILGYEARDTARCVYHSEGGWLERPRQRHK